MMRFPKACFCCALMAYAMSASAFGDFQALESAEGKPMFGNDAQGRMTAITNAINKVTAFAYDANGNLVQRTAAGGQITAYQYSPMNRLTNVVHQGVWKAAFSYDANGNTTIISNPVSRIAYSYDPMNRLTNSTLTVSTISTSLTVSSSYDLNGNRTNIVYPGGLSVAYGYDAENRLVGVTTKYTNSTKTFALGYDGASRLTSMSYPNGVNSIFGYDAESRITNYVHGAFLRHAIQRDPRGFKTVEDIYAGLVPNFTNGLHQTRTHNDADQLTVATSSPTNLVNYSYDPNGCLTNVAQASLPAISYAYDYDNRLLSVSSVSSVVQYLYDASGARVGRVTSPGVTNYFVIDYKAPLKMPLAEADALGRITRYYVWSSHGLLAHLDMNPTNGALLATRYYHADELGSTLALTDANGTLTDQFAYSPYGQLLSRTGTNDTPYLWIGGLAVRNEGNGLYYMLNRYYSTEQRRFISIDPMGIDGGVNLYSYAGLNPTSYSDPFGLEKQSSSLSWYDKLYNEVLSWLAQHQQSEQNYARNTAAYYNSMDYWQYSATWAHAIATGIADVNEAIGTKLAVAAMVYSFATMPASTPMAYRAVDPKYAQATLDSGFYKSGSAGRLGNDGIYANSSVQGAVAEFQYHNPGVSPTVFEVKYSAGSTLNVNPPSGNFYVESPLPFTQGANTLSAPSLRQPGTMNYLIRDGAVPGRIIQ